MPAIKCYTSVSKYCFCIEFQIDEDHRHGFPTSLLIHYRLDPNPDAGDDKNAPPQKLTLAFSNADVVILGWKLSRLMNLLNENNLATVFVLPKPVGQTDQQESFVATINITSIEDQKGTASGTHPS